MCTVPMGICKNGSLKFKKRYEKYDEEFDQVSEALKNERIEEVGKTTSENLSTQLGWVTLILQREKRNRQEKL